MVLPEDPFYGYLTPAVRLSPFLARILVPQWRGLMQSEAGLENRLQQSLPPHFVSEFRSHYSEGRSAQERRAWERAIVSFLRCKTLLIVEKGSVEKKTYSWLLASVDLPLAQLYQMRGVAEMSDSDNKRVEMLQEALEIRREIYDCMIPFFNTHGTVVRVCEIYYYTALYELGCLTNLEAKIEAVQRYAQSKDCDMHEAKAQLCHFLYLDHCQAGSFGVALQWIQEAHRLWKELCPDGSFYASYCLDCEAKLLMKLEMFPEAVTALEGLPNTKDYVHQEHPGFAIEVCDRLQECYTQLSRRAAVDGNAQLAKSYEDSAELQQGLKLSLSFNQKSGHYGIPESHPVVTPMPFPVGSALGLVQAEDGLELYVTKLPMPFDVLFTEICENAQTAQECGHWEREMCEYQMAREFLKISKNLVDNETHYWLLTWVDLPLACLYHYRAGKFEKAVEIWKEMLDCMSYRMPTNDFLCQNYAYVSFLAAVEFEWKCSDSSDGKCEVIRSYASTLNIGDDISAECLLCFWLYFGHYHDGSLDISLKWLREAKRLDKQHSPDRMCSSDSYFRYFCCDYDYLRCEADLLIKLLRFGEAVRILETLLETRHVLHQETPKLASEARQWLQNCYVQVNGIEKDEATDLQRALECSLNINHHPEGIAEQLPSPTGCIMLVQVNECDPTCGHPRQFIQSKAGLEQHFHKLPVPIHLAIQKHAKFGLLAQDHADWEGAIFQFEWCRELLKLARPAVDKETFDWLLVWVDIPLAQLYEFKNMQSRKALDKWIEISRLLPVDKYAVYLAIAINFHIYAGMYQSAVSDYPELKEAVLKSFGERALLGMPGECLDRRASEIVLLNFLQKQHFASGNLEVCLHFAQQERRLIFEQSFQGYEHDRKELDKKKLDRVIEEAVSFINLRRFEDAEKVLEDIDQDSKDIDQDSKVTLEILRKECSRQVVSYKALMESYPSSAPLKLRLESLSLEEDKKFAEAVKCHEKCLELLEKRRNDYKGRDEIIDKGLELGFYDHCRDEYYEYRRIGELHKRMYFESVSFPGAPFQDAKFLRAVECFEKCIELSVPLNNRGEVAQIDHNLVQLYAMYDCVYYAYIMHLYNEIGAKMSSATSPVIKFDSSDPLLQQSVTDLSKEIAAYLHLPNSLEKFARKASTQHAAMLYTRKRYVESYIDTLDYLKLPYIHLQEHYYRKANLLHILVVHYGSGDCEEGARGCRWKAFLYAERERTRAMLYQLGSISTKDVASELRRFENDDLSALAAIQKDCATLSKEDHTVFVQYSNCMIDGTYIIYVIDQDGQLSVTKTKMEGDPKRNLKSRLKDLHSYFEPNEKRKSKRRYNEDSMNEDLEYLYDVLMRPIADHLDKMKPEYKLILVPSELLSRVPFAALRDRHRSPGQRYLIERHTIALTFSLRVHAKCSERLQDLQKSPPYVGHGSIIALGNPAYGGKRKPLEGSGDEVKNIASLFPGNSVVTLLGQDASAKKLLHWAEKPTRESFRQAIIHIGAHGDVDEVDHTKNVLRLACDATPAAGNRDSNISRGKKLANCDDEQEEDDYTDEDYSTEEDDTEAEAIVDSRMSRFIPKFRFQMKRQAGRVLASSDGTIPECSRSASLNQRSSNHSYDLEAGDIIDSETGWRAELVVLSACSTSKGKMTSEGVLSLARAFMIAGVPCVVASQWRVGDQATVALMNHFYRELQAGKDVACALRSAMLELLKDPDRKVREWAPFAVWGVPTLCIPEYLQKMRSPAAASFET